MRHSVLVVDDDEGFLQMVTRLLELRGFTVVAQAASRADALAVLRRCRPDSVLVDVNLPDGDGLTLAREVARRPDPPRIVLTSSDDLKLGASVLTSAGIHAFALKDTLVQIDLYALFIGP